MLKRLWLKLILFFKCLTFGMKGASDVMFTQDGEDNKADSGVEQQKEQKSVYADLLRGELTEEVKELRHEMYYAERKSYKYAYSGNGTAVKKPSFIKFNGHIENSEDLPIQIVQDNKEDNYSLSDFGIHAMGEDVSYDENAVKEGMRNFTIKITREFIPTIRIEEYVKKIVVKRIDDENVILDLYVSQESKEFDRRSRIFKNKVDKIYLGDEKSDIIDFNGLSFTSSVAYGTDDLKEYAYKDVKFHDIVKFDGSYVLKFTAKIEKDGSDMLDEIYNEKTEEKSRNHEKRDVPTVDFSAAYDVLNSDRFDVNKALELTKEIER